MLADQRQPQSCGFITKLQRILLTPSLNDIVRFDKYSQKICVLDKEKMEQKILPTYFRHNNFHSFVRQLNLYGFRKIKNSTYLCFTHNQLQHGHPLSTIKPKKYDPERSDGHSTPRVRVNILAAQSRPRVRIQNGFIPNHQAQIQQNIEFVHQAPPLAYVYPSPVIHTTIPLPVAMQMTVPMSYLVTYPLIYPVMPAWNNQMLDQ